MPRGAWEGSLMFWAVKGPARGQQTPEQMPRAHPPVLETHLELLPLALPSEEGTHLGLQGCPVPITPS